MWNKRFICRPAEFGESEKKTEEQMIPSDMLPPSDSELDSDGEGEMAISNPNRPLIQCAESDEDSSEEENEMLDGHHESDGELDEKHYVGWWGFFFFFFFFLQQS